MAYYNTGEVVNSVEDTVDAHESYVVDDLTVIPLHAKSFAICELCSRVGRREQFYPRNNKFCSLRCHASNSRRHNCHWRFKFMEGAEHLEGFIPLEPLPQLEHWKGAYQLQAGPIKQSASATRSYEWKDELFGCDFLAAPVSLFKHAPLHEMWDSTFEGMKVEVHNNDTENDENSDYLWVATVLKVKGYMGLLRYEGFGSDDSKDFWVNLCCSEVTSVGCCAMRGKPLIPPHTIRDKYTDWKKFLVKQLTGARTLPANFYTKLTESNTSRFQIGSVLEVLDKNRISQVKVATVCEIIGKRLHIKYYDSLSDDMGFWCHEDSQLIHPVGWAFRIGHKLDAPETYLERVAAGRLTLSDTTQDMFHKYPTNEMPLFAEGLKLEAIDPLNLSSLCAATIMQILNEGYMMIRIDCYPVDESGGDWFCYHQRSPCIFPVGFAMANNIPLTPPAGFTAEEFSWEQYLVMCDGQAAPHSAFAPRSHVTSHGFVAGMRLECTDLMDPRLVCVATIARVVGDLLKIHFDGWGPEYDQWSWAHSTDMYPVGWCRAVSHVLQGPNKPPPAQPARRVPNKQAKAPRRRKKVIEKKKEISSKAPCVINENSGNKPKDRTNANSKSRPNSISENADMETRTDTEARTDAEVRMDTETESGMTMNACTDTELPVDESASMRMDVDEHSKHSSEPPDDNEEHSESTQEYPPTTESLQDSSQNASQLSPDPAEADDKVIPRLVNTTGPASLIDTVDPVNWTQTDVAKFLKVNDCEPYCQYFTKITGEMMLQLTKDKIIELMKMKVGPSLKIFDLIQQLKCKLKQPQCRRNMK